MTIQEEITEALTSSFEPSFLSVENESHRHNVPPGSESHFKVTLVSQRFVGARSVKRHQAVYGTLASWLAGPVHALALHTYTAEEWAVSDGAPASPDCRGGTGK
ncbi:MAG: transcriptional regulator [Halieaceae bacterium]|jgi:BolA protein|nr:transcriptional regulator [Halieaceae bacterium]MAI93462.1 transcriptional regulator [Halieaceae bacterium]|tara:strand:- start:1606 stop:1917 length:312 start_codon:yes stop_codon:yes gene_type:complete